MTTLGKRPLQLCLDREDTATAASPKKPCRQSRRVDPVEIAVGDTWDGIECDEADLASRDRLVSLADDPSSAVADLVAALGEASTFQVELAMIKLFGEGVAFSRLCRAIAVPSAAPHSVALELLLCRAARQGRHNAVSAMIVRLAEERDVAGALTAAVEEDDGRAVEIILKAYENDVNTPDESYRRLASSALHDAVEARRVSIVAYLAALCDGDAVEEMLSDCVADEDDVDAAVFAALWQHADLCAHDYAASLSPCRALDYLKGVIASGEACADGCTSNLSDDDSDQEEEEDDDQDHRTDRS